MDALDELVQAFALRVAQRARLLVAACGVDVHVGHCVEFGVWLELDGREDGRSRAFGRCGCGS